MDIEMDEDFVVDSVSDQYASLLKRLKAQGITPDARFHVTGSHREELLLRASGTRSPCTFLEVSLQEPESGL